MIFNKKICNSFLIICVNIRSLSNPLNFSKLESFVHNLNPKPDIIAVTETWIQNNSSGPYCYLENYNFISNSRKVAKGGGVGLYIKNCHKFNLIDELTIMNEKIFESIFIKIQLHNENLFCGNIYRSPSNDNHLNEKFLNNLYNCIHNSNESLNKCFITGDFNYDLSNQDNEHVCNFIEMMLEGHYFPVINKPTRITDTSATVLDHIWTNLHQQQIKSGVILNPLSDHLPVYMCFNLNKQNLYRPQQKRSFTPQSITKFNEMLENIDINAILNETNPNLAFKLLMDNYKSTFNYCFPFIKQNIENKNKQPWFDNDLYLLMLKKNKCFKKFLKNRSVLNKANFNKERNTYNRALQEKKQSYFRQTFKKLSNNLKETWKNINKQLGKVKSLVCSSISINNNLVNDSLQITNYFNNYFVNVANNLVSDLP